MEPTSVFLLPDAAKQLKVEPYVLRYFCNKGLIPGVRRNRRGYRVLTSAQIDLADVLIKMRRFGFTTTEIRQYSRLYRQGESTLTERMAILTTRKRQLWQEIVERQDAIDFIERQEEQAQAEQA